MMETIDVIHTSEVNGVSKSISSEFAYFAWAIAPLRKYAPALETSMATRITKIQTSSCACVVGALDGQQNECDQGHAGDAVGFKAVGAGAHGVARVVTRAVCDHARVARIVFLDLEYDLHQVGANVGDLGEDAAGNTQRRGAQRLANREANEAWARIIARDEQEDERA